MSNPAAMTVKIFSEIAEIGQKAWDLCAANPERPFDPFTSYRFLAALEESGSVGAGTGWQAHHIAAYADQDLVAVAPCYAKSHSQGEYIFDHNWAHAYENAGGDYYPKIQITVPFTPATGARLLTREGAGDRARMALIQGAKTLVDQNGLSGFHMTFCTQDEYRFGKGAGLLGRLSQQFHWVNSGYADFEAFLGALSSRKRKNIRKERAVAQGFGGRILALTGDQIQPHHWDAFWVFYQDTGARKWGSPYLSRGFFDIAQERLRDDILLVMCEREGQYVAGALNFIGGDCLYGRYWGCVEDHRCLHFEVCYYQAIEFAISRGLARVEAGAQGAHKLARGYLPQETYSAHYLRDAGFAKAVSQYLEAEARAIGEEIDVLTDYGPFRKGEDLGREIDS